MTRFFRHLVCMSCFLLSIHANAQQPAESDTTFDPGSGFDSNVYTTAIQNDGRIIAGGTFYNFNGLPRKKIARLNPDGSADTTFDQGTGFDNDISIIFLQNDGKILAGGWYTHYNGTAINRIARLHPDGTLDTTFNPGAGPDAGVMEGVVQNDGKILIGGRFSIYNNISRNKIARLFPDGSLDTAFSVGTAFGNNANNYGLTIAIQPDSNIIVGGVFSHYNGVPRNNLARLHYDGSLDTNFNVGSGTNSSVFDVVLQPDGKILIGGFFTILNGLPIQYFARLNGDGSVDTSFNTGTGPDMYVHAIILQNDGKIIIAGDFTSYNGVVRNRIARLHPDGTLDSIFNPQQGLTGVAYTTLLQSDGKIIAGGDFTAYNGISRNRIVRLNGGVTTGIIEEAVKGKLIVYPNPLGNTEELNIMFPALNKKSLIAIYNNYGQVVIFDELLPQSTVYRSALKGVAAGLYFVQLISPDQILNAKVVRE